MTMPRIPGPRSHAGCAAPVPVRSRFPEGRNHTRVPSRPAVSRVTSRDPIACPLTRRCTGRQFRCAPLPPVSLDVRRHETQPTVPSTVALGGAAAIFGRLGPPRSRCGSWRYNRAWSRDSSSDPSTGQPHMYGHDVTKAEVEDVLAQPLEDRQGSEGSRGGRADRSRAVSTSHLRS